MTRKIFISALMIAMFVAVGYVATPMAAADQPMATIYPPTTPPPNPIPPQPPKPPKPGPTPFLTSSVGPSAPLPPRPPQPPKPGPTPFLT